jgi:hypothetical protein
MMTRRDVAGRGASPKLGRLSLMGTGAGAWS